MRPGTPADAPEIVRLQAAAWRPAYGGLLPVEVLDALDGSAAVAEWAASLERPAIARSRVLIAEAGTSAVGFAAYNPVEDDDLDPGTDAEIVALTVDPEHRGQGHGSRLVNATVDHLRRDGFGSAYAWLAAAGGRDDDLHRFLGGAGWAEDGARRELDLRGDGAVVVTQVRLHAAIDEPA